MGTGTTGSQGWPEAEDAGAFPSALGVLQGKPLSLCSPLSHRLGQGLSPVQAQNWHSFALSLYPNFTLWEKPSLTTIFKIVTHSTCCSHLCSPWHLLPTIWQLLVYCLLSVSVPHSVSFMGIWTFLVWFGSALKPLQPLSEEIEWPPEAACPFRRAASLRSQVWASGKAPPLGTS